MTNAASNELSLVYVTVGSEADAVRIGTQLVQERLAACANVSSAVTSIYEWQGVLERSQEVQLFMKARSVDLDVVIARVKELHGYECPCIVALPITAAFEPFRRWVLEGTTR